MIDSLCDIHEDSDDGYCPYCRLEQVETRHAAAEAWASAWKLAAKRQRANAIYWKARAQRINMKATDLADRLEGLVADAITHAKAAEQRAERLEAVLTRRGNLTPYHLQRWADDFAQNLGFNYAGIASWLREVADILADAESCALVLSDKDRASAQGNEGD